MNNKIKIVIGSQWGDEGKGKIIDYLSSNMDLVCRCQGGSNAGHTVIVNNKKYAFHLLPSCLINPNCNALIGNGVVVHLQTLIKEIKSLEENNIIVKNRLFISDRCHIVFDFLQQVDANIDEERGNKNIGTTRKGIGPTYSSKLLRNGIRICDLFDDVKIFEEKFNFLFKFYEKIYGSNFHNDKFENYLKLKQFIEPYISNTTKIINDYIKNNKKILIECANGSLLDIDFGSYPYVTSSNCGVAGICSGLGIPPKFLGHTNAVVKAYTTRVGQGPFLAEIQDNIGITLREKGQEYGTTTGRPRRCGWLDLVVLKHSIMINGVDSITLTKVDVFDTFDEIQIITNYKDNNGNIINYYPSLESSLLKYTTEIVIFPGWKQEIKNIRKFENLPINCQKYISFIQESLQIPIYYIGVGASRDDLIVLKNMLD